MNKYFLIFFKLSFYFHNILSIFISNPNIKLNNKNFNIKRLSSSIFMTSNNNEEIKNKSKIYKIIFNNDN